MKTQKINLLNCGGCDFRYDDTLPVSEHEAMREFINKGWELGILNNTFGTYYINELWWVGGALRGIPEDIVWERDAKFRVINSYKNIDLLTEAIQLEGAEKEIIYLKDQREKLLLKLKEATK